MIFSERLNALGLNLQAVFEWAALPNELQANLSGIVENQSLCAKVLLFGHAGKRMWETAKAQGFSNTDPIDTFSKKAVEDWLHQDHPGVSHQLLYPGDHPVQLQCFGQLAGWHFASPFMVGVNDQWGSWFAYRALVVVDHHFKIQDLRQENYHSPCVTCADKPCLSSCPARAVSTRGLDMSACVSYRLKDDSHCKNNCLSRYACPVAAEHRYSTEQLSYHYRCSMDTLKKYYSS